MNSNFTLCASAVLPLMLFDCYSLDSTSNIHSRNACWLFFIAGCDHGKGCVLGGVMTQYDESSSSCTIGVGTGGPWPPQPNGMKQGRNHIVIVLLQYRLSELYHA